MNRAFTIIELMISIAVIGLLSAIALPKFSEINSKAKVANVQGNLANLRTSIGIYMARTGEYPDLENNENLEDIVYDTYKFTDFYSRSVMPYTPTSENTDKINSVVTTRSNIGGWLYLYDTGDIYANLEDGNYTGDEVNEVWEEEGSTDTSDDTSDEESSTDSITAYLTNYFNVSTVETDDSVVSFNGGGNKVQFKNTSDASFTGVYYIFSDGLLSDPYSLEIKNNGNGTTNLDITATEEITVVGVYIDSSGNTVYYYTTL